MQQTLEKWSLDKHYKSIHVLGENSSKEESLTPIIIVNQMVETILQTVDITIVKNPNFKVLDSACGTGSFLIAWYEVLSKYHSHEHIINNMLWGFETNFSYFKANNKYYQFKNVHKESFLETIKLDNMKFDHIVNNPPYEGKKELHQKFFNKAVDLLKDGGSLIFVQPATPYLNNKPGKSNQQLMRQNVLKYKTNVKLINPNIFENAAIMSTLAITHLVKNHNDSNKLESVEFESGKIYTNVDLRNINYNGMDIDVFIPLRDKIEAYIQKNGSCESIYYRNDKGTSNYICKFPRVRGHMNNPDFYTFIPNDSKYLSSSVNEQNDFGLRVNSDLEIENMYHYVRTFVARFCLSITKCTIMNQSEFRMIPLVDFSKRWTDESLCDEFGITEYEYSKILELIPPYYGLK